MQTEFPWYKPGDIEDELHAEVIFHQAFDLLRYKLGMDITTPMMEENTETGAWLNLGGLDDVGATVIALIEICAQFAMVVEAGTGISRAEILNDMEKERPRGGEHRSNSD